MKNKTIISVRSNCDFALNYETGNLHPHAEIIFITTCPKYKINSKKSQLVKDVEVEEFRFKGGLDAINKVIGELQIVVSNMNKFDQLAGSMNAIISAHQQKENKANENSVKV